MPPINFDRFRLGRIFGNRGNGGLPFGDVSNLFKGGSSFTDMLKNVKFPGQDMMMRDVEQRMLERRLMMNAPRGPVPRIPSAGLRSIGAGVGGQAPMRQVVIPPMGPIDPAGFDTRSMLREQARAGDVEGEEERAAREKISVRETDIDQQRINLDQFEAEHPKMEVLSPKGGTIIAVDPMTGEVYDTGIPSDNEEALIKLRGRERRETVGETARERRRIGAQTISGRAATNRQRHAQRMEEIRARGGKLADSQTPREERMSIRNKAQRFVADNPEFADKITFDGEFVTITPPKGGWFKDPTEEENKEYEKIVAAIYDDETTSTTDTQAEGKVYDEDIKVYAPNGQEGTWPAGEPLPPGYIPIM